MKCGEEEGFSQREQNVQTPWGKNELGSSEDVWEEIAGAKSFRTRVSQDKEGEIRYSPPLLIKWDLLHSEESACDFSVFIILNQSLSCYCCCLVGKSAQLFFFFNFNWRLITLQYCGGLYHTLTWISHECPCMVQTWNPLTSPSQTHPSRLSQCTSFECPISWIKLGLDLFHIW